MKLATPFAISLAAVALIAHTASAQDKERDAEPRSRMLLVFAPDEDSKPLNTEFEHLQRGAADINGEDIDVVYVVGDRQVKLPPPDAHSEPAANLRKRYHVDTTGFRVVLVGKDGWEKARWSEPEEVQEILKHANEMPKPKSETDKH